MRVTDDLRGKRVTVMGLGHFGGGLGVTRWLLDQGARVLVTDLAGPDKLAAPLRELQPFVDSGAVALTLGEHAEPDFIGADLVVANPAAPRPWENRFLHAAKRAGVPVTTEIRLVVERLPDRARVIGVTGAAGKSTTSAMIAHILGALEGARRVHLGGNIGGSLLSQCGAIRSGDWVVLELSSAMLHWLSPDAGFPSAPGWSPSVAVVTNITPNHIDWHADFAHYAASKRQIVRSQCPATDLFVHMASDPPQPQASWSAEGVGGLGVQIDSSLASTLDVRLRTPGAHNRLNALLASTAASLALGRAGAADSTLQHCARALATFPGLPHRLQWLGEFTLSSVAGANAYNDSKSTTPEAAALAIRALDEPPGPGAARVRVILGGYDKKVDLSAMIEAAARCAGVYTVGVTGPAIAHAVTLRGGRAEFCADLERAVGAIVRDLRPGDSILLSPGCASWDQFTNFERRGEEFERRLRERLGAPSQVG